jgi:transcriptional regulator with XRE-family HTH domain
MHHMSMQLSELRKSRGLSQRLLAEMVGVDQATIQRAEKMHKSAMLATYVACAKALQVSLSDIFATDRSAVETELLQVFRGIPEAKHPELLRLLRLAQDHAPSTIQ